MSSSMPDLFIRMKLLTGLLLPLCVFTAPAWGQVDHCDPQKVLTADACIKCHAQADAVWKTTLHFKSFETLHRTAAAKSIAEKMEAGSIKRGKTCVQCHYTQVDRGDRKLKPVAGISCESCHGAGKEWVPVHHDYGGPNATRDTETPEHATMRLKNATRLGMRNPHNLYNMARSCLGCHTTPNEKLVNVGGHPAGSPDFEMVSWSQGSLRHNFLRTGGKENAVADRKRLRVMWLSGLIADLEYSTRAVALATRKDKYGLTAAKRAADTALKLYGLQQNLKNRQLETILTAFAKAELKINNREQLNRIADVIEKAGLEFAELEHGENLASVDPFLPTRTSYR